jgi:hypothetical protein
MPRKPRFALLHVIVRNRLYNDGHQKYTVATCINGQFAVHHNCAASNGGLGLTFQVFPSMHRAQPTQPFRLALSTFQVDILLLNAHVRNTCCFVDELIANSFAFIFRSFQKTSGLTTL